MRTVPTLVLALALAPLPAAAQPPAEPPTVRVSLKSGERVTGFLRGTSADEIVIYTAEARDRRVPILDVQRVETRSQAGSHLRRGALIGLLVWGSVVATGAVDAIDEAGPVSLESGGLLLGATVTGALVGRSVPRYGWRTADPRSLSDRPSASGGIAVSFGDRPLTATVFLDRP